MVSDEPVRDFLDDLDLTAEERERLRGLGARDASGLRAMHRAAPQDFEAYFGPRAAHILRVLDDISLPEPPSSAPPHGLGARAEPPPSGPLSPRIDIALRDRLFRELQDLKSRPHSAQRDAAIADLEDQLNVLLDESL